MTQPTGVFVRLPLSEEQIMKLYNQKKSGNENLLAVGTPVTGGELKVAGCIAPKQAEMAEKGNGKRVTLYPAGCGGKRWTVELTRYDKALAKLAEKDAEIARYRKAMEEEREYARKGSWSRAHVALHKALKGPEA